MIYVVARQIRKSKEKSRVPTGRPHSWSPVQHSVSSGFGSGLRSPPTSQATAEATEKNPRRFSELENRGLAMQNQVGESSRRRATNVHHNVEVTEPSPTHMQCQSPRVAQVRNRHATTGLQGAHREVVLTPFEQFMELHLIMYYVRVLFHGTWSL